MQDVWKKRIITASENNEDQENRSLAYWTTTPLKFQLANKITSPVIYYKQLNHPRNTSRSEQKKTKKTTTTKQTNNIWT